MSISWYDLSFDKAELLDAFVQPYNEKNIVVLIIFLYKDVIRIFALKKKRKISLINTYAPFFADESARFSKLIGCEAIRGMIICESWIGNKLAIVHCPLFPDEFPSKCSVITQRLKCVTGWLLVDGPEWSIYAYTENGLYCLRNQSDSLRLLLSENVVEVKWTKSMHSSVVFAITSLHDIFLVHPSHGPLARLNHHSIPFELHPIQPIFSKKYRKEENKQEFCDLMDVSSEDIDDDIISDSSSEIGDEMESDRFIAEPILTAMTNNQDVIADSGDIPNLFFDEFNLNQIHAMDRVLCLSLSVEADPPTGPHAHSPFSPFTSLYTPHLAWHALLVPASSELDRPPLRVVALSQRGNAANTHIADAHNLRKADTLRPLKISIEGKDEAPSVTSPSVSQYQVSRVLHHGSGSSSTAVPLPRNQPCVITSTYSACVFLGSKSAGTDVDEGRITDILWVRPEGVGTRRTIVHRFAAPSEKSYSSIGLCAPFSDMLIDREFANGSVGSGVGGGVSCISAVLVMRAKGGAGVRVAVLMDMDTSHHC